MDEKELNNLLDIDGKISDDNVEKYNRNFENQIRKKIAKQIYKRVVVALLIIGLAVTILYKASSFVVDKIYYNPMDSKGYFSMEQINDGDFGAFNELIEEYAGLFYPNQKIAIYNKSKDGFGTYSYEIYAGDNTWNADINWCNVKVKRNKIVVENPDQVLPIMRTYSNYKFRTTDGQGYCEKNSEFIDDIKATPDSACFMVNMSFENPKSADEIAEFINQYSSEDKNTKCEFRWIATDNAEGTNSQHWYDTGISLYKYQLYGCSEEFDEKYPELSNPDFYIGPNYTGDMLTTHYLSSMKLMLDNEDFMKLITENDTARYEDLKLQYENVKENGFKAIGVSAVVNKATLLKLMEEDAFQYLYIDDAVFSELGK